MKKLVILFVLFILLSCSTEMTKNTIWEGSGTIKNPEDNSISEPYIIEKAIFYGDGTIKFKIVSKDDDSLSGTFKGNYTLDYNDNLTFTTMNSYYTCIGSGKLSYYGNVGSGKASCLGLEMTWKITKVSDF